MVIDIYLKNEKEKIDFHFPVTPLDSLSIKKEKRFETVDIVNLGEFDIKKEGEKIREISFKTFLPFQYDASYCRYSELKNPTEIVAMLEKWVDQAEPLRLIITGFGYNGLVTISSFSNTQTAGREEDRDIEITFRTYRELKIETLKKETKSNTKTDLKDNRPNTQTKSKIYTVKASDTLYKIAKNLLGKGSRWPEIYNIPENKKVIGKNPNIIKKGQKLVIPSK
ncbi:TPA: LysM peptidoglycan-binding domain-containing protein [Clostridioides difficile]|uniref:LysM peptidoglycan-binding domain-containing protein n=1 Tax=Clostridioides difficile TaxID=1496 RepID=UPI00097FEEFD|nr:LysM peptidoglycan-binding domain-containing protein [Clostridioides difficile]EGT3757674.1 LysM peptidoglycan-binding domain-containing protein [Clostridioides difficile]EGT4159424.1 LysM peptidoglycan-binding domain-containing protein [Clostridioides difficile]EGT4635084.1 LysM peptidoglycan-binding domain-containing protein [Clostridioides difficile]EGT4831756.1 LysM peptidoglycan-binding domain-containing protein [Clostridioides difficile]EII6777336.1 LysM peptidoglycan-binding domain-c